MPSSTSPDAQSLLIHDAFLRRVVRYLITEGDDVDDVVQEVWVAALKKPPKRSDAARSWLWSVASNVVRLRLRTKIRADRRERRMARSSVAPSSEEIREREAVRSMVLEQLLTLPDEARDVLVLRFFEDLSWKHVAKRLGVPAETARTRGKRARVLLRERIAARSGGDPSSVLLLLPLFDIQRALSVAKTTPLVLPRAAAAAAILAGVAGLWALLPTEQEPREVPGVHETSIGTADAGLDGTASTGPELVGRGVEAEADERATSGTAWHLSGRVVDEAQRPLPGVAIGVGRVDVFDVKQLAWQATSRADGHFELIVPRPEHALRLAAHTPGHTPVVRRLRAPPGPLHLVLPATGLRHFVLRDRDTEAPLEGVRCTYVAARAGHMVALHAMSDAGGRVAVDVPWPTTGTRQASLCFLLSGYTPESRDESRHATGGADATSPAPVYLSRAAPHVVRVVDLHEQPVAGAQVRSWSGDRFGTVLRDGAAFVHGGDPTVTWLGDTETDAEGVARIPFPIAGRTVVLMATTDDARGFALYTSMGLGRTGTLTVTLRPTTTLHGRVVVEGTPVAEADVFVALDAVFDRGQARRLGRHAPVPILRAIQTRTDRAGRFRLAQLPLAFHGRTLRLFARHAAFGEGQAHLAPDADLERALEVTLPGGGTANVRVRSASGVPVPHAEIMDRGRSRLAVTGIEGDALLAHDGRKTFEVHVRADGFSTATDTVTRDTGATVTLHAHRALSGTVVDEHGAAAPGEVVLIGLSLDNDGKPRRVTLGRHTTSAAGGFTFEDARDGPWEIHVTRPGTRNTATYELSARTPGLTFALPPARAEDERFTFGGRVMDHDGTHVTRYEIMLRARPPAAGMFRATLRGYRFLFSNLPPGTYDLEAWAGSRKARAEVRLTVGEAPPDVELTFSHLASLPVQLMIPTGFSAARLRPRMRKPDGPWHYAAMTDGTGHCTFRNVEPGTYLLGIQPLTDDGVWWVEEPQITLAGGDAPPLRVAVRPAGRVQISVVDARLRPRRPALRRRREYSRVLVPAAPSTKATAPTRVVLRTPTGEAIDLGPIRFGVSHFDEAVLPGQYEVRVTTPLGTFAETVTVAAHATTLVEATFPE